MLGHKPKTRLEKGLKRLLDENPETARASM
jgi:hypothetical protein